MKNLKIDVREGLSLRFRSVSDAPAVFEVMDKNRSHLEKWLNWIYNTKTVDDVEQHIRTDLPEFKAKEGLDFGIWFEDQWVGGIGFHA